MFKFIFLLSLISLSSAAAWNYSNPNADWPTVNAACTATGTAKQSPIDVPTNTATYNAQTLKLKNSYSGQKLDSSGNAISVLNAGGHTQKISAKFGQLEYNNMKYDLVQFHTHQPAEHTFNGNQYDMEMHFVHSNADPNAAAADKYLVLGYYFNVGSAPNEFLTNTMHSTGSATSDATVALGKKINPWDLMKQANDDMAYVYSGSFTTPPCTEGVTFILFQKVMYMSMAQWTAYNTTLPTVTFSFTGTRAGNIRPTQAINARTVEFRKVNLNGSIISAFVKIAFGAALSFFLA